MTVSYQLSAVSYQQDQSDGAAGEQLRRFGMTSLS